jgi:hypothetical protein
MRPIVVVIANEFGHEPLQMAFIQHDDMIEQVTAGVPGNLYQRES